MKKKKNQTTSFSLSRKRLRDLSSTSVNKQEGRGVTEVLLKLREEKKKSEQYLQTLHQLLLSIARAFAAAVETKDPYSKGHSQKVTQYTLAIARELPASLREKFSGNALRELQLAAFLHDIGKIAIRNDILDKNGPLNEDEWKEIKKHPRLGAEILEPIKELKEVARHIKHHHERVDGKGYPDGLKGEEIPLASRIIAVADAFEAMTAARPYRDKMPRRKAIEELRRCSGRQFDKRIIEAFTRAYKKKKV